MGRCEIGLFIRVIRAIRGSISGPVARSVEAGWGGGLTRRLESQHYGYRRFLTGKGFNSPNGNSAVHPRPGSRGCGSGQRKGPRITRITRIKRKMGRCEIGLFIRAIRAIHGSIFRPVPVPWTRVGVVGCSPTGKSWLRVPLVFNRRDRGVSENQAFARRVTVPLLVRLCQKRGEKQG